MKVPFSHFDKKIKSNVSIEELSKKLFHLGHEHEIHEDIFDFELTPNRGDCLSLYGLLRDLNLFYDINLDQELYDKDIPPLAFNFSNNAQKECNSISFLKIEIDEVPTNYLTELNDYFVDLDINKNNFFTDISNFISYENGQPTHCYDALSLEGEFSLDLIDNETILHTLLDKKIKLSGNDLVFMLNKEVVNLAGIIGNMKSSCSDQTKSVIVECAYFKPEVILGKCVKYNIQSDAAHKFERGVDPLSHKNVLKRFLKIVEQHTSIKKVEMISFNNSPFTNTKIPFDIDRINRILGTDVSLSEFSNSLHRLGFKIVDNDVTVPSYRSDVKSINDLAEEIARAIGYDNIPAKELKIMSKKCQENDSKELKLKNLLIHNGFNEVINNPFTVDKSINSIQVDNPLDSNKNYLRINLKDSLIKNLLFNQRRQKDSIKLFEISDVYFSSNDIKNKRVIGIVASGRKGKNYEQFSKKIDADYIKSIVNKYFDDNKLEVELINKEKIKSRSKDNIYYIEADLSFLNDDIKNYEQNFISSSSSIKYIPISEFPSSSRDLSFSIIDPDKFQLLQDTLLVFEHELLAEKFIFDFFVNNKNNEIKIAYRFIFQAYDRTLTDEEIDIIINDIIKITTNIENVSIPGLNQ